MSNSVKFGRVVLIGRPNAGKSTLLNAIMGQKVAITSPLPQTTRKSIRVVYSDARGKIIFSDTPGILNKVEDLVGRRVNEESPKEIHRAGVVVYVIDISRQKADEENKSIGLLRKSEAKKILVYNKTDKAKGPKDHLAEYNYLEEEFDKVVSVSALKVTGIKQLVSDIFELLPEADSEEVENDVEVLEAKDRPVIGMGSDEYIAEIIREKAYLFLRREIPYSISVRVESVEDKKKVIVVKASLFTNTERYKKMIIGKNGRRIKEIGFNARKELELMSGRKVFLELTVRVDKHWMESI